MSAVTDGLEKIVTDPTKAEPDLLLFFKNNPGAAFLLEPSVHRQWREQSIQYYGRIDFVFELVDGTFRVIEIESHAQRLFTKSDEFAQPFRHAVEQVRSWIRGVTKLPAVAKRQFGCDESDAYRGLVVMGRLGELSNPIRKERWHAEKKLLETMTWDDIIARGRLIASKLMDPSLDDYEWEDT